MTTCPSLFFNFHNTLPPETSTTSSFGLCSLPPSVITNIFYAFTPQYHQKLQKQQRTECNHAWIRPAFQFALSNSHLYHLYTQTMYNPALDDQHQHEFLTTDCQLKCFTTLLSGLTSLTLVRRSSSQLFDAQFVLERTIHTANPSSSTQSRPTPRTSRKSFSAKNSTLCPTQIDSLFTIAYSFPSLHMLELSNAITRENNHLWTHITQAWSHSLESLSIDDSYAQFDQTSFNHFTRFRNLQRLVISSRAVQWIYPLQYLTTLTELVLRNCNVYDHQVLQILSNMTSLRALDLTETCVTPNIVNSLPTSIVRFAGGERDAHCGDQDHPAVTPGLPPIDVRQATLFDQPLFTDHDDPFLTCAPSSPHRTNQKQHWKQIVTIQPITLPKLKFLEWGEWITQKQSAASLRYIIPQLESLCLCGPDYDDEFCDILMGSSSLKCLELYACNISDVTAHVLSQLPFLEFINITNCQRITPRGLVAICTGRAARTETLESVFFFGQVQTPSEALSDLLADHRDMFSDGDVNYLSDTDSDMSLDET